MGNSQALSICEAVFPSIVTQRVCTLDPCSGTVVDTFVYNTGPFGDVSTAVSFWFAWKWKPMDSFGTWRKWKSIFLTLLMHNFIELYELLIALVLTSRSEMPPFSENEPQHKNVRSPPEHFAIGYVHNDNLPLGNIALQYVIQNNCRKIWWCILMISCIFWRSRNFFLNSPKLSCGI